VNNDPHEQQQYAQKHKSSDAPEGKFPDESCKLTNKNTNIQANIKLNKSSDEQSIANSDERPDADPNEQSSTTSSPDSKPRKVSSADKIKFAGLLLFLVLVLIVGIVLFPYFGHLTSDEGRMRIITMIQDAGAGGILVCLGLQFVQIVVAFIPGEVTQLAIGAIYGPFWGTLVTALGALISSIFVFYVVRKLGAPFVSSMIGSKQAKRLRFLRETKSLDTIIFVLFLIPGLPKDVFTYLVPLTAVRPINFFIFSTLGRIPGIFASAYIGNATVQGDYLGAIIVGVIAGGLGLLGIIFNKQILAVVDAVETKFRRHR
jgi:uncharacterized membrane protein YdjX (TVP38/TMEM64 family)